MMKTNTKNYRGTDNHISEVMEGRLPNTNQRGVRKALKYSKKRVYSGALLK